MRRWQLWILAAVLLIVAIGVPIGIWALVASGDRGTAAAVIAGGAAVVQAITAVVIVALTLRLATATDVAQEAAKRQADVASRALEQAREQLSFYETADRLARRDRHLLETPTLRTRFVEYSARREEALTLYLAIHNDGETPALAVRCEVRGANDASGSPSPHFSAARVETLPADGDDVLEVGLHDFTNISWLSRPGPYGDDAEANPHGALTYPWLVVQITYEGLLGQKVRQVYRLWVDALGGPRWYYQALSIRPALEGVEPLELTF